MSSNIIIGVHGLRNKPEKSLLTKWWRDSIEEGFNVIDIPVPKFDFEMAYWAHHIHKEPLLPEITDKKNPRYLEEKYVKGKFFGPREPGTIRHKLAAEAHKQMLQLFAGKSGFMNVETISNIILHRMFVELDIYYNGKLHNEHGALVPARELIVGELTRLIKKHAGKNILLIAHSMGAVIAYDAICSLPEIPIHTLVTIGAPLGFPVVIRKFKEEKEKTNGKNKKHIDSLYTPENITHHWLNFSDLEDVTCLNYNLRNNYKENSNKVRPFDYIVYNNYEYEGVMNPHKSYGYLRTAEVTRAINDFLSLETASTWQKLKRVFSK